MYLAQHERQSVVIIIIYCYHYYDDYYYYYYYYCYCYCYHHHHYYYYYYRMLGQNVGTQDCNHDNTNVIMSEVTVFRLL